ncbi:hsp90 co-chaperone Cdc37 [Condylostylus longicornis]|uniref:hsp90 co-chaperone Cdc37 n=1 Tax=Condylostylus longicornis TaxID=2530218 RepID=UPI00244DE44D|nr:hsp90 co-chaperone Cdc37 [Condylostylus longicornis]
MVDYSKWKEIEISDDEDDTHPNIDTPSLFRWRHQARMERMEQAENEKKAFEIKKKMHESKVLEVKEKLKKEKTEQLQKELEALELAGKAIAKEEDDMKKKEKKTPWNVDTISKPGFQKTVINKKPEKKDESQMSEEERERNMKTFIKQNEKMVERYGMLRKYDDSKKFLLEHHNLVCDDTANYLVIWCINLEMEEKHELMAHVAHQCICMQYILELGKQLDIDPRACVGSFFDKIQNCVPEYREQFEKEIEDFKKRIQNRAKEKIEEAIKEQEEEDREARLGPGGLDPVEVLESLPKELQACFESRDIKLLQETIAKMPEQEAVYHMKRCVDSGLWIPEGGLKENQDSNKNDNEDKGEEKETNDK